MIIINHPKEMEIIFNQTSTGILASLIFLQIEIIFYNTLNIFNCLIILKLENLNGHFKMMNKINLR